MKPFGYLAWILFLGFTPLTSRAAPPEPFRVVFIDDQSAEMLGGFPLPRKVLAAGIEAIAAQKPRGIILKLFIDLPKDSEGDQALALALTKAPMILQARVLDTEPKPNPMPDRFYFRGLTSDPKVAVSGRSGWLPLESLAKQAHDIGFVDIVSPLSTPMVERYQGRYVKSLCLCALEMAFDGKARIEGHELKIAERRLVLDGQLQASVTYPAQDDLDYLNFGALLEGKVDAATFTDKIVILGYDGSKIPKIQTPIGELKAHRVFCYSLFDSYGKMQR
jgi:hypothetical protein